MIDLPSLPTDSLYKFLALSGVVIVLSSVYFFMRMGSLVKIKSFELMADMQKRDTEISFLEQQPERSKQEILKVRIDQNVATIKLKEFKWLTYQLVIVYLISSIGLFAGTSMAYQGFNLWYSKIQIHQDKILEFQVQNLNKKKS